MQSATGVDPLTRIENRLAEMRRRTISTLTVTNPADGIAYLEVGGGRVTMRDGNGTVILLGNLPPEWGYQNPWANYTLSPTQQGASSLAVTGPMQTTSWATLYPNQPRIKVTVNTKVGSTTGGIADTQVAYTVNGGSPTVIPASVAASSSTSFVSSSFEYVWPADYFGDKIQVLFQARIRPGTGDPLLDTATFSPSRLYGSPL